MQKAALVTISNRIERIGRRFYAMWTWLSGRRRGAALLEPVDVD